MKYRWTKVGSFRNGLGEGTITYANDKNDILIESRRRAIPHSGRSGHWFYTSYFVIDSKNGRETERETLAGAKELAEGMGT